jgi:HlyD family secretion protein
MTAPVLFTIANDLREMHIHANVPEADIGNIREGQRADFTVDAYRETFNGRVIQVRNQPIIESHVVMYDTIIEVGNPEGRLKPGMTATVSIITDEQADVLRVPNTALRARLPDDIRPPSPDLPESRNGEVWRVVYRLSNGSPEGPLEALPVRVGMTDGAFTKVLEGLNAGDTLVTGLDLRTSKNGREEGRGFGPLPARF